MFSSACQPDIAFYHLPDERIFTFFRFVNFFGTVFVSDFKKHEQFVELDNPLDVLNMTMSELIRSQLAHNVLRSICFLELGESVVSLWLLCIQHSHDILYRFPRGST